MGSHGDIAKMEIDEVELHEGKDHCGFVPSFGVLDAGLDLSGSAYALKVEKIPPKSRPERQIPLDLTIYPAPPGIKKLRLPRQTIPKLKLTTSTPVARPADMLELHTMVVCSSTVESPDAFHKSLARARLLSSIHTNASQSPKELLMQEDLLPSEGGEVRICQRCVERERKRAGRARVETEEGELWARTRAQDVIVFNTNEIQEFCSFPVAGQSSPSIGILRIRLPMRLACYCRHQNEKTGFRVILTVRDSQGHLIAQTATSSIMITDDRDRKKAKSTSPHTTPCQCSLCWATRSPVEGDINDSEHKRDRHKHASIDDDVAACLHHTDSRSGLEGRSVSESPPPSADSPSSRQSPLRKRKQAARDRGPAHHKKGSIDAGSPRMSESGRRRAKRISLSIPRDSLDSLERSVAHDPTTESLPKAPSESQSQQSCPRIHKLIPSDGPASGGVEITCLGSGFKHGMEVMFGDTAAVTTTFWGSSSLVCIVPPSARTGKVPVLFRHKDGPQSSPGDFALRPPMFEYTDDEEQQLMRSALSIIGQSLAGRAEDARDTALRIVNSYASAC